MFITCTEYSHIFGKNIHYYNQLRYECYFLISLTLCHEMVIQRNQCLRLKTPTLPYYIVYIYTTYSKACSKKKHWLNNVFKTKLALFKITFYSLDDIYNQINNHQQTLRI